MPHRLSSVAGASLERTRRKMEAGVPVVQGRHKRPGGAEGEPLTVTLEGRG